MTEKKPKGIINYPANKYLCNVIINGRWFTKLEISQYYKTKPGRSTVNDEVIQELVKQLNNIEIRKKRKYYDHEPLYIGHRAYNLVWDYDESPFSTTTLLIIDCYRERKYDKSK